MPPSVVAQSVYTLSKPTYAGYSKKEYCCTLVCKTDPTVMDTTASESRSQQRNLTLITAKVFVTLQSWATALTALKLCSQRALL